MAMFMRWMAAAAAMLFSATAWPQGFAAHGCAPEDKDCHWRVLQEHPSHKLAAWQADLQRPVAQRIGPAPPLLVEYLHLDNEFQGWQERPRAAQVDAAFLQDVQAAMRELPPQVLRLVAPQLVGIYLVEELGGTGFTDVVFGPDGNGVAAYVVLDAQVLAKHTANAWATWKENTPFRPDPAWRLKARIEDAAGDNRKNAIQYILLHELGHVASIGRAVHPPWFRSPEGIPATARFPFFDLSWKIQGDDYVLQDHVKLPQRKDLAYYQQPKMDGAQMQATYQQLERHTGFASLYAATRPGDDFAEAFSSYAHVVLLGRPWEITIERDGKVVQRFGACWQQPRCAGQRAILEKLLAGARE